MIIWGIWYDTTEGSVEYPELKILKLQYLIKEAEFQWLEPVALYKIRLYKIIIFRRFPWYLPEVLPNNTYAAHFATMVARYAEECASQTSFFIEDLVWIVGKP